MVKSKTKPNHGKQDFWYVKRKLQLRMKKEIDLINRVGFRTNAVTERQLDFAVDEIRPMDRISHETLTKMGIKNYYVSKR